SLHDALPILGQSQDTTIIKSVCGGYYSPTGKHGTSAGTFMDTLVNQDGCNNVMPFHLTVNKVDAGVSKLYSTLTANQANASYQWMYCDSILIQGETKRSFVPSVDGSYAVIVTVNGCTDTSKCVEIRNVDLPQYTIGAIEAYPNPTNGYLNLVLGKDHGKVFIELINPSGG